MLMIKVRSAEIGKSIGATSRANKVENYCGSKRTGRGRKMKNESYAFLRTRILLYFC